jgi:hypothetical protein
VRDTTLERFKAQLKKQAQAARVAKLLAMAIDSSTTDREFNELAWELSLWLPPNLVWELTRCLCNDKGAMQMKEILIAIRTEINGKANEVQAGQIIHRLSQPNLTNVPAAITTSEVQSTLRT